MWMPKHHNGKNSDVVRSTEAKKALGLGLLHLTSVDHKGQKFWGAKIKPK
jgi:hypothetical protein